MNYFDPNVPAKKKQRKKKIIWFNPPWSQNIKTNIGGKFLSMVRKHFKKGTPLYHLFNTKRLKVSYSTVPNMQHLISRHNHQVLRKAEGREKPLVHGCNCIDGPASCPLQADCLIPSLVYEAQVKVWDEIKSYIGQTANTFKTRWNGHNSDINTGKKSCGLASYMKKLKRNRITPDAITWQKLAVVDPRGKGSKNCPLCLTEKVLIARADHSISLNSRSEVMNSCRHRDKLLLTNQLSRHHKRRPADVQDDLGGEADDEEEEEDQEEDQQEDREDNQEEETGRTDTVEGGQKESLTVIRRSEEDSEEEGEEEATVENIWEERILERRLRRGRLKSYKQFFYRKSVNE